MIKTNHGMTNLINFLQEKHTGKIKLIKETEHYCNRRGLLNIIFYTVNGLHHRKEIENSHYVSIVVYGGEV